jgi:c-di-GMP-binding flagellar brake protein YcgR
MNNSERRKYVRIKANRPIKHTRFALFAKDLVQDFEAMSKDISAGGVLFESQTLYAPGDLVRMEIDIPGWEKYKTEFIKPGKLSQSLPVSVLAKVIQAEIKAHGLYEIRAAFVGIDEDHQKALSKFLVNYK